jgi:hypothetical protein
MSRRDEIVEFLSVPGASRRNLLLAEMQRAPRAFLAELLCDDGDGVFRRVEGCVELTLLLARSADDALLDQARVG